MSKIVWCAGITVALILCALLFYGLNQRVNALDGVGRLVTVYDRGSEKVLLSEAGTIGDALKDAGVTLDSHDVVEPAVTEKMIAPEYQINIYRARPVTVVDGPTKTKVVTAYQTAEQIVKDSGMSLFPEDTTTIKRSEDMVVNGAGLQVTIDRATVFGLNLYGTQSPARTQATTVGDMLKEKNISLGKNDKVSTDLSSPITTGTDVRVWREGRQTITVEETVAFPVEKIQDADRPTGYSAVQSAGTNGTRNATYDVEIINGQEVTRTEIASLVTLAPVTQVEVVGTKPQYLPYTGGGTKSEWLAASNIPASSWGYADFMVTKESGWNPNARNKSSGACGLAQALPCSKVPGDPLNPVNSLNWMNDYVNGRYGGWQGAYDFWQKNRWY
ncbi:DUF348 domain-containing protein [Candidatus Saccharibacteria bacterium]|nr:DUF348 domain-containing protein [Candidatus Saccharibacteria bacterium]